MRVLSVTLLSFLATLLFGAALLLSLPMDFQSKALWLTVWVPLIWMGFMLYCYWDSSKWRVFGVLTLIIIASLATIILSPTP